MGGVFREAAHKALSVQQRRVLPRARLDAVKQPCAARYDLVQFIPRAIDVLLQLQLEMAPHDRQHLRRKSILHRLHVGTWDEFLDPQVSKHVDNLVLPLLGTKHERVRTGRGRLA